MTHQPKSRFTSKSHILLLYDTELTKHIEILIRNIEDGGVKMLDVKSFFNALQATWIKRILENPNNIIGNTIIDNFGPEKLLLKINNVNIDYIKNVTSLFYKQGVTTYISTKSLDES